MNLIQVNTA